MADILEFFTLQTRLRKKNSPPVSKLEWNYLRFQYLSMQLKMCFWKRPMRKKVNQPEVGKFSSDAHANKEFFRLLQQTSRHRHGSIILHIS